MTDFVFTDVNDSVRVIYRTDLPKGEYALFTVMDIIGLSAAEVTLGFNFPRVVTRIDQFIAIAETLDLKLEKSSPDKAGTTVIRAISNPYLNGGLGIDNL